MIGRCPVCNKMFDVLWPHLWVYRRGGVLLCSYKCMRLIDKGDATVNKRLTEEQKEKAIAIAMAGESPIKFISSCGVNNASTSWYYIKKSLNEKQPEIYAKLPEKFRQNAAEPKEPAQIETPEGEFVPALVSGLSLQPEIVEETADDFNKKITVTAIRVEGLGEFYFDKKFKTIDWRTEGGDEVSLGPAWWLQLVEDLPKVLKTLGVTV